jgi:hypothetical protein
MVHANVANHASALQKLVLEQIVKGGASIIRTLVGFARSFLFDHHSYGIKRTVVALVFGRNSRGDGLGAFEAGGWIEVFALLAGMQGKSTLGTFANRAGQVLQERSALGTARDGAQPGHIERARPESIFPLGRRGLLEFFFCSAAGILISVLAIFAIGQIVPPENFQADWSPLISRGLLVAY